MTSLLRIEYYDIEGVFDKEDFKERISFYSVLISIHNIFNYVTIHTGLNIETKRP